MMHTLVPTSHRDWNGYMKKNRYLVAGYTWRFRVHENAWARSVILIFAILNVFHYRQSTRHTFLPNSTTTLLYTRNPSTIPIFAPTVPHGQFCTWNRFFLLVCTIQSVQNLDALIKYVAQYHILYIGQLEIRLSVYKRDMHVSCLEVIISILYTLLSM